MKLLVLFASPNKDGLTAACAQMAVEGARGAGAEVELVCLNDLRIARCAACDNGWGTCRPEHRCQVADDFQATHARVAAAEALVFVSPVYWGEMSESAKAFTDRFRRCEATRGDSSCLAGKKVLLVAAAGGGGGGTTTCLGSMERWAQHVRARVWDLIPLNRWSRAYKLEAIREAARSLVAEG